MLHASSHGKKDNKNQSCIKHGGNYMKKNHSDRKQVTRQNKKQLFKTNLYNLIAAVSDAISPGEEALIPVTVTHLIKDSKGRFIDNYRFNA